jgi:hypothetical protein
MKIQILFAMGLLFNSLVAQGARIEFSALEDKKVLAAPLSISCAGCHQHNPIAVNDLPAIYEHSNQEDYLEMLLEFVQDFESARSER